MFGICMPMYHMHKHVGPQQTLLLGCMFIFLYLLCVASVKLTSTTIRTFGCVWMLSFRVQVLYQHVAQLCAILCVTAHSCHKHGCGRYMSTLTRCQRCYERGQIQNIQSTSQVVQFNSSMQNLCLSISPTLCSARHPSAAGSSHIAAYWQLTQSSMLASQTAAY